MKATSLAIVVLSLTFFSGCMRKKSSADATKKSQAPAQSFSLADIPESCGDLPGNIQALITQLNTNEYQEARQALEQWALSLANDPNMSMEYLAGVIEALEDCGATICNDLECEKVIERIVGHLDLRIEACSGNPTPPQVAPVLPFHVCNDGTTLPWTKTSSVAIQGAASSCPTAIADQDAKKQDLLNGYETSDETSVFTTRTTGESEPCCKMNDELTQTLTVTLHRYARSKCDEELLADFVAMCEAKPACAAPEADCKVIPESDPLPEGYEIIDSYGWFFKTYHCIKKQGDPSGEPTADPTPSSSPAETPQESPGESPEEPSDSPAP